jgi:CDGSH-type Zn-finger protein/uncharacterized Fe-S cluster protein YjdI
VTDKLRSYEAAEIVVTYDVKRCIQAAECVKQLPTVFDASKSPWIQPGNSTPDEIASVIEMCPSGALQYRRNVTQSLEPVPVRNELCIDSNGPLYLRGDIDFIDSEGVPIKSETRVALCRCGASRNKPFCDNSHKVISWSSDNDSGKQKNASPDPGTPSGKFLIYAKPNGSIKCRGTIAVVQADGATAAVLENPSLCRCGASLNKPFCDGAHKANGFTTD